MITTYKKFTSRRINGETAALHIHNDVLTAVDKHQSFILLPLDIFAAFDTINHLLLFYSRLKCRFGICGKALDLFSSYLFGRRQFVKGNDLSSSIPFMFHL